MPAITIPLLADRELRLACDRLGLDDDPRGWPGRLRGALLRDQRRHRVGELDQPDTRLRGNEVDLEPPLTKVGLDDLGEIEGIRHVHLVEHDQAWPVLETSVRGELALDDVEVADRVAARLVRRAVDHVHDRLATLDVAQEVVAEATAVRGALDEPWHISDGVRDCLLYTSDAADEEDSVDLGGRRIIKKKKKKK